MTEKPEILADHPRFRTMVLTETKVIRVTIPENTLKWDWKFSIWVFFFILFSLQKLLTV